MLKSVSGVQRNAIGQMLAQYVNAQSMWPDDGPFPVLRDMAFGRAPSQFSDSQRVVLRIAFDIFDGSGGGVTLVEAADASPATSRGFVLSSRCSSRCRSRTPSASC